MPAARVTLVGSWRGAGALPPPMVALTMAPPPRLELHVGHPGVVVEALQAGRRRGAGVVDEDVHAAELGHHRLDEGVHIRADRDIGDPGKQLAAPCRAQ
jgi:hypothetical protein